MRALAASKLFDGVVMHTDHAALIQGCWIADICPISQVPPGIAVEALPGGWLLAPGYVDLQVNGGGDVLFNDRPTANGIDIVARTHRRLGTTAILPTVISGSATLTETALGAAAAAIETIPGIIGIHLEGPHLAPSRRGIHPADAIRQISEADLALLGAPFPGTRLITLAPELAPDGTIARLAENGIHVFAGHCEAGWHIMQDAHAQGLRGVTHLFNAMAQTGPREPGTVGAALGLEGLYAGIILDGLHVHPANVRLAYRALGASHLFLVSDAMPTVGGATRSFQIGQTIVRLSDGQLTAEDRTLGGAHLCMAEAVRYAVDMVGIPLRDALAMATSTPAAAVSIKDVGHISAGARADLIALDARLHVRSVWQHGQLVSN